MRRLLLRCSNFCSAAEKRYADITEKAHFYGALFIILRPCKMMGASFAFRKTSHSIFLSAPSMAQAFIQGDFPFKNPLLPFFHFPHVLCYTPLSYEYGKFKSRAGEGGQYD